jgi:hypothetical protein
MAGSEPLALAAMLRTAAQKATIHRMTCAVFNGRWMLMGPSRSRLTACPGRVPMPDACVNHGIDTFVYSNGSLPTFTGGVTLQFTLLARVAEPRSLNRPEEKGHGEIDQIAK